MSQTFYVSPTGNDSNAGTLDQPFQSVQNALGRLTVGQGGTIFLRGGTYSLNDPIRVSDAEGGNQDARLVIRNFENEKVILDGTPLAASQSASITLSSTNAVDIQGLEIFGSFDGIDILGDSKDIVIRNNIVHDVQQSGIAAFAATQKGISNVLIDGNTVYRTNLFNQPRPIEQPGGWGSGIVFSRTEGGRITNNRVYENYGEGIAVTLANNAIASNNTVYDNFSVQMYMDNATNSVFEQNFIYNTGNTEFYRRFTLDDIEAAVGIQLANEKYADQNPLFNDVIRNNVVVGGDRVLNYGGFQVGGGLKNALIANNTFYSNSSSRSIVTIDPDAHENTTIANNIFFKESPTQTIKLPPNIAGLNFSTNLWFGGPAGAAASPTDVTENPLLANPGGLTAKDYQILAGSPAIGKGTPVNAATIDFLGATRPTGAIDIGAYQLGGSPDSPPSVPATPPVTPPVVVTPPVTTPPVTPPVTTPPVTTPPVTTPPFVVTPPVTTPPVVVAPPVTTPPITTPPVTTPPVTPPPVPANPPVVVTPPISQPPVTTPPVTTPPVTPPVTTPPVTPPTPPVTTPPVNNPPRRLQQIVRQLQNNPALLRQRLHLNLDLADLKQEDLDRLKQIDLNAQLKQLNLNGLKDLDLNAVVKNLDIDQVRDQVKKFVKQKNC